MCFISESVKRKLKCFLLNKASAISPTSLCCVPLHRSQGRPSWRTMWACRCSWTTWRNWLSPAQPKGLGLMMGLAAEGGGGLDFCCLFSPPLNTETLLHLNPTHPTLYRHYDQPPTSKEYISQGSAGTISLTLESSAAPRDYHILPFVSQHPPSPFILLSLCLDMSLSSIYWSHFSFLFPTPVFASGVLFLLWLP